jgi:hypothetical protein
MWLQPLNVELKHDSAGAVIEFGRAQVEARGNVITHDRSGSAAAKQLARDAVDAYARHLTSRYDEYARALPDLHRLREAAKILALAHWAQSRGVKLVPPGPPAPAKPLPASFQRGFWTGNFFSNSERYFFGLVAIGGVDFGPDVGSDWVQTHEDRMLGSTALQQLAGSAALAQQAAAAAESGDLESARSLADQSARAMTGDLDFTGHPALGKIPEVPPPERVAFVEFQNELVIQNQHAISTLASAPAGSPQHAQAVEHVRQIQNLLVAGPQPPAQTKHWVMLLRGGDWASLPSPAKPAPAVAVTPPLAPKPVKPVVDPVERARVRDEITQLRTELCRIQVQLRRFNKTIQSDQDQRAEWEKVTNDAYESALQRAQEKFEEFSVDFPGDILKEKLESVTDPAERAKIERALRLVDRFKDAYTTRDFSTWAAKEEFTREEIIEGIKQIADICEVEDRIKEYFSKKWGLKRAFAFYDAADDLITSAYDVTAEVVAWDRLKQLNRNSDDFLKATEASGRRLRVVMEGIRQREIRLGLDPGSTKEPCAQ